MNQFSGMEKKLDSIASAVKSLDKTSGKAASEQKAERKRAPIDVDALTSEEVEALRQLIEHESDLMEYSSARIAAGGEKVSGMYAEFNRLGLAAVEAGGRCVALLPMAHWAVEKHDQRSRDAELERKAQWRHDLVVASVSTAIGGALGIDGTLLGVLVG